MPLLKELTAKQVDMITAWPQSCFPMCEGHSLYLGWPRKPSKKKQPVNVGNETKWWLGRGNSGEGC